ncbi:amidohydrolase [Kosmotoga pacifica]|uniref:amidohydrolase n=1 Tax=Kosmotoga pacifica TaxID=1330330 RepID=UPI0006995B06|nr:amidohydrolase [Kosmotoga pacifica]
MNRVFKNCRIYNPCTGNYVFGDLFIEGGVIVNREPEKAEVIDLGGRYVYPGMVDSHAHLVATGKKRFTLDLTNITSESQFVATLKEWERDHSYMFINGRGWDQERLGFVPDKKFLDNVTNIPVVLVRKCGHIATVNSSMIQKYSLHDLHGIDETDLNTGIIKERALEMLYKRLSLRKEDIERYLRTGASEFLKYGVTSVHSDDYHDAFLQDLMDVLSTQNYIRIYEKLKVESLSELENLPTLQKYETDFFTLRAAKIYLDGSFGSRTAALRESYTDEWNNNGILYLSGRELLPFVQMAESKGIQLNVHVIGDRALDEALEAFKVIKGGNPLKHRLIHVQIAWREQIELIARLKLKVSIQPIFFKTDKEMAISRLGPNRIKSAYPFKALLKAGIELALSTDSPVEGVNPYQNMQVAEAFFDRKDILYMYMVSGRLLENRSLVLPLSTGSKADFFVLERELLSVPANELDTLEVIMTVLDGRIVHTNGTF